ncbi:MAG: FtsX-like permease family protein [Hyphomicrobiales bacterium]
MNKLDVKMIRDLRRIWAQALAIAMVLASGVATLVLGIGAYRSLDETRSAYYERYRFADLFAYAERAPNALKQEILQIPGVATADTRLVSSALLDVEGMAEPATGRVVSLPDNVQPALNRLYMRRGRTPEPYSINEVTVNEAFAEAHGFEVGSTFHALLNGRKRELTIVGMALSPEFIYALGPGDMIPDDRRFAILWMSEKALAETYDLDGAFNAVSIKLLRNARPEPVMEAVDNLLDRYGGLTAFARKDQQSHAFLDAELNQLAAMSRILPPIFLLVSVFLINITLSRLIALEREQIGLMKALGYGNFAIGGHYLKLVLVIALVGLAVGLALGLWLGHGLTVLYADFFQFPFLIFLRTPDVLATAVAVSLGAAGLGAMRAVYGVMTLPPAVAMSPSAPTRYDRLWLEYAAIAKLFSQMTVMVLRHLVRWPFRAGLTTLGIAMSVALFIASLFSLDSVEFMIDTTFFQTSREDARLAFTEKRSARASQDTEKLPGVMRVEPFREVAVRFTNGHLDRKTGILGIPPSADLTRIVDLDIKPFALPETGLVLSDKLAQLLDLRLGDMVGIEVLEDRKQKTRQPVTAIIQSYVGLAAYMNLPALNRLMDEGPVISGVNLSYDEAEERALFDEIKNMPSAASFALRMASLRKFRETMEKNISIFTVIYSLLSALIAFGVVYNSARIQLSERARELASMRVLGFTRTEVSVVLLLELAILTLAAIPLGWVIGYGFAMAIVSGFDNELYRIPFVISPSTYAQAAILALVSATVSAAIVRRRIDNLDLVSVLKTRD